MNRLALAVGLSAALIAASGCKKQQSNTDAIRAGIMHHLTSVTGLNLGAMDMDIHSVSVNGNQAHAEVEFRPKGSTAPQGTGMQVAYDLEKRDDNWVVLKTQPMGGMIQHPDPNQNPRNQDVHTGTLPNFSDVLKPSGAPAQGAKPLRQPSASSQQPGSQPGGQDPTSYKKPR